MSRILIGVTGNIASGKSETARMLQERGFSLVDADIVAHDLYGRDRALVQQIASEFGADVLWPDGSLNRKRLGSLVFGKPEALARLNRIVHPALVTAIRARILDTLRVLNRVVLDAALIVELGFSKDVDFLVVVSASEQSRLDRLMARSGLTEEEARRRLDSQMPEEEKLRHADFVIHNGGTRAELQAQVDVLWEKIKEREAELEKA